MLMQYLSSGRISKLSRNLTLPGGCLTPQRNQSTRMESKRAVSSAQPHSPVCPVGLPFPVDRALHNTHLVWF